MRREISIVIPARNEADALRAGLPCLLAQRVTGPLQIIVAANGCSDDTEAVAGAFREAAEAQGHALIVLPVPGIGKPAALNAADAVAEGDVRVYLDADARLSAGAIQTMVDLLRQARGVHYCTPRRVFTASASPLVNRYLRGYAAVPYVRDGLVGHGVYAVSAEGRRRWGAFPPIHSDDKFARMHFAPAERRLVEDATVELDPPADLRALLRARTRWCRGNRQFARRFPRLLPGARERYGGVAEVARRPELWGDLAVFGLVHVVAKCLAALPGEGRRGAWTRPQLRRSRSASA